MLGQRWTEEGMSPCCLPEPSITPGKDLFALWGTGPCKTDHYREHSRVLSPHLIVAIVSSLSEVQHRSTWLGQALSKEQKKTQRGQETLTGTQEETALWHLQRRMMREPTSPCCTGQL